MSLTQKQIELDKIKWEKSEKLGFDACGTFEYCKDCDKTVENPCEKAYTKFKKTNIIKAKKEIAATATKKTTKKASKKTNSKKVK